MKRILATLLAVLMLSTVIFAVPVTTSAATIIDSVKVTDIDEPYAGKTADYTGSVEGEGYKILYIDYYDKTEGRFLKKENNETFVQGHTYEMQVALQYESGYQFATNENGSSALTGVLIGYGCQPSKMDGTVAWAEVLLRRDFVAYTLIDSVKVTDIDEPYAGKTADYTGSVEGEGYKILYIDYYDKTDGRFLKKENNETFVQGHTYEMQVALQYESGYKFATDENGSSALTGVLIGYGCQPSKMDGTVAWAEVIMRKSFIAKTIVNEVAVTDLDEPAAGATPDYEATVGGEGYKVYSIDYKDVTADEWIEQGDGKTFVEGHAYEVVVTLQYESNYEFAVNADKTSGVSATLNGKAVTPQKVYNTAIWAEIELRYTFDPIKVAHTEHNLHDFFVSATTKADGRIDTYCDGCDYTTSVVIPAIAGMKISAESYTYNGKVKTPSVVVVDVKGNALKKDVDYKVTYSSGRKNVGKYKVTVKFMNKYDGTITKTFVINPKSTKFSKVTGAKKKITVKWKKQTTQTTGYQIQYATKSSFKGAKTVTVKKNKTTSANISKLKAKTKYYVRIRTYKTVSGTKYYSTWSAKKSVKTK